MQCPLSLVHRQHATVSVGRILMTLTINMGDNNDINLWHLQTDKLTLMESSPNKRQSGRKITIFVEKGQHPFAFNVRF